MFILNKEKLFFIPTSLLCTNSGEVRYFCKGGGLAWPKPGSDFDVARRDSKCNGGGELDEGVDEGEEDDEVDAVDNGESEDEGVAR